MGFRNLDKFIQSVQKKELIKVGWDTDLQGLNGFFIQVVSDIQRLGFELGLDT